MSSLLVPTVTERTPRGDRLVDLFSRLLGERIVFLSGQIEDASANLVVAQLPAVNVLGAREVQLADATAHVEPQG